MSGLLLFVSALAAMVWANSGWAETYRRIWEIPLGISFDDFRMDISLHYWINDGLMAMFFFVVGLELKREFMAGELSNLKKAMLPLAAAVGGMVVPALIYLYFNPSSTERSGWGIPMATDIAFALGVLTLLGNRVPFSLKVFLTALAIADDLGAVLVIALFYTSNISIENLALGALFLSILISGNNFGIRSPWFYALFGIGGLWLAFFLSGVHATIAGVLAAFTIPVRPEISEFEFSEKLEESLNDFRRIPSDRYLLLVPAKMHVIERIRRLANAADTPLQRLEYHMHGLVAFVVLPLFALANAGITFDADTITRGYQAVTLGVAVGLFAGKFIGVVGACLLFVKMGWATLPHGAHWVHVIGIGFLAGIGFTMSLFITNLAFRDPELVEQAKLGIMGSSIVAGTIGYLFLRNVPRLLTPDLPAS